MAPLGPVGIHDLRDRIFMNCVIEYVQTSSQPIRKRVVAVLLSGCGAVPAKNQTIKVNKKKEVSNCFILQTFEKNWKDPIALDCIGRDPIRFSHNLLGLYLTNRIINNFKRSNGLYAAYYTSGTDMVEVWTMHTLRWSTPRLAPASNFVKKSDGTFKMITSEPISLIRRDTSKTKFRKWRIASPIKAKKSRLLR